MPSGTGVVDAFKSELVVFHVVIVVHVLIARCQTSFVMARTMHKQLASKTTISPSMPRSTSSINSLSNPSSISNSPNNSKRVTEHVSSPKDSNNKHTRPTPTRRNLSRSCRRSARPRRKCRRTKVSNSTSLSRRWASACFSQRYVDLHITGANVTRASAAPSRMSTKPSI